MATAVVLLLLQAILVCVQASRLSTDRDLDISMYVPVLKGNPTAAATWRLKTVELYLHAVNSHFAIKITSDDSKEKDALLYHYDMSEGIGAFRDQNYPYQLAKVKTIRELKEDGTFSQEVMTLGKMFDCVSAAGLTRDTRGRCMLLSIRAFRFAAGDCVCGGCNDDANNIRQMITLKKPTTLSNVELNPSAMANIEKVFGEKIKNLQTYRSHFKTQKEYDETPAIMDCLKVQMKSVFKMVTSSVCIPE